MYILSKTCTEENKLNPIFHVNFLLSTQLTKHTPIWHNPDFTNTPKITNISTWVEKGITQLKCICQTNTFTSFPYLPEDQKININLNFYNLNLFICSKINLKGNKLDITPLVSEVLNISAPTKVLSKIQ